MAAAASSTNPLKSVQVTVDGRAIEAAPGTPLLQAMLDAGMDIPHYCYHPKLSIDGSCRFCEVKIEGMPKLQISCNTVVRDGMVVHTQDPEVALARRGVMELLLINHPLDCPICDKAGECWLQNFSMRFGSRFARTLEPRRKRQKRIDIGERMLLDQERCILCRRCVRFCREISHTGELVTLGIGDHTVLDVEAEDRRLDNDYSICTADVCPVGALESKDFHHRIRVWFLDEVASVCPGCANGCNVMTCVSHNRIWRLIPRRNDQVNDTWMCDAGRLNSYRFVNDAERLRTPMVANDGKLAATSWDEALKAVGDALIAFKGRHGASAFGAVISPHLTNEENFRFGEFLRAMGVDKVAMAVKRGKYDDFLIKAEKAPNARGVRELGLVNGDDDGMSGLIRAAEAGELKGLYLCSDDLFDTLSADQMETLFGGLELLIVHGLRADSRLDRATAMFPTTTYAEKNGSFTNHAGRVQQIFRAIETPPGWLTDGDIFTRLMSALDGEERPRFAPADILESIARKHARFAGFSLEMLGGDGAMLFGEQSQPPPASRRPRG